MQRLILWVCLMSLGQAALCQKAIDSLQKQLISDSSMDTLRVNAYNELAWEWAGIDPQVGLRYADSAEILAAQLHFESGRIAAVNRRGVNYWYAGMDSLAILAYQEVLDYHLREGNLKGQATSINNIALLNYNQGDYREALENHQKASAMFETLQLPKNLINSLSNEGVVFLALGDYPRAMEVFLKALFKSGDEDHWERGNIYNNLGLVYKNLQQLDSAKANYLRALSYYQKLNNRQSLASTLGNLGAVSQLLGEYRESEDFLHQALQINRNIGNQRRIASDLNSLGGLFLEQNQLQQSLSYLDSAREIYAGIGDHLALSQVLIQLARAKEKQGVSPAELYGIEREALANAQKSTSLEALQNAWLAVSHREKALGQFEKSLNSFEKYTEFKDSIFNQANEKKLLNEQIGYEYNVREKKLRDEFESERLLIESEREREKLRAILLSITLLSVGVIGAGIYYFQRRQSTLDKKRMIADYRAKVAELELKALRAQMNPHFIFNALSSISNFLLKNQAEEADRYLTKFSRLIRRILEYSQLQEISFQEEIALLEDYIALESLRLGKAVVLQVDNPDSEDLSKITLPPLLLQPLVENSLWHGISNNDKTGVIKLGIFPQPDCLIISLKDNGSPDRETVRLTYKTSSLGLSLVRGRLEKLQDSRGESADWTMLWENLKDGFEVKLRLTKPIA